VLLRADLWHEAVDAGGLLMSYGDRADKPAAQVPYYVDRMLKGARPSEVPVEQTHMTLSAHRPHDPAGLCWDGRTSDRVTRAPS
jgi:hypothetical protein